MQTVVKGPSEAGAVATKPERRWRPIPVVALSLGASLLCMTLFIAFALSAWAYPPLREAQHALSWVLPGFSFVNLGHVLLGVIESFAFGLYAAILLGCVYNYIVTRKGYGKD